MPLYATACDTTDSWAPVKLNFWFDVRSKSSYNNLCVPYLASRLAFSSPAGPTVFEKVVIAPQDRKWDTIGLMNSLLGTLLPACEFLGEAANYIFWTCCNMEWSKWRSLLDCIEDCHQLPNLFWLTEARYFNCCVPEVFRAKPHTTSSLGILIGILQAGPSCVDCSCFCMFFNQWVFPVSWVCTFCIAVCETWKFWDRLSLEVTDGLNKIVPLFLWATSFASLLLGVWVRLSKGGRLKECHLGQEVSLPSSSIYLVQHSHISAYHFCSIHMHNSTCLSAWGMMGPFLILYFAPDLSLF